MRRATTESYRLALILQILRHGLLSGKEKRKGDVYLIAKTGMPRVLPGIGLRVSWDVDRTHLD